MKKFILTLVFSVLGALLIGGGAAFATYMNYLNTVSFEEHTREFAVVTHGEFPPSSEERHAVGERIWYPSFRNARGYQFALELSDCYAEVDNACWEYANMIAGRYNNNADLDFTVDLSGNTLTIVFKGTGYPENGEPESLDRTYIFDIEGVGANKLPKLLNRAEIIGY